MLVDCGSVSLKPLTQKPSLQEKQSPLFESAVVMVINHKTLEAEAFGA